MRRLRISLFVGLTLGLCALAAAAASKPQLQNYTYHGCPVFASNDWFTTDLIRGRSAYARNAIDPYSASIIANLAAAYGLTGVDFSKASYPQDYAVNIDDGSPSWFMVPIVRARTWYGFYSPSSAGLPKDLFPVRNGTYLQEGTDNCTQSGGDCHVVVLDTVRCIDYEAFGKSSGAQPQLFANGRFVAQGGGIADLTRPYNPPQRVQVTAAGLPLMGSTDWGEDAVMYDGPTCRTTNSCVIPHILQFLLPSPDVGVRGRVPPASAGTTPCTIGSAYCGRANTIPYGARLRLKSSYRCPGASMYPQANMLCNQAKQYGWIFADTTAWNGAGGVRLGLSSDGSNPWHRDDDDEFLGRVRLTDFDVMRLAL
jgi:hypothetical protein